LICLPAPLPMGRGTGISLEVQTKNNRLMKILRLFIASFLLLTNQSFSQVAINSDGNSADTSAILDISSTTKGILIPRVSTSERILRIADGAKL